MIALDTNILVYAHRAAVPEHKAACAAIRSAGASKKGWGVTLPSVAEFFTVVTHPSASGRPSTAAEVEEFFSALSADGDMGFFYPGPNFERRLIHLAFDLGVSGARIFDLQIGLTALDAGATELWTHDRNFARLPGLKFHDPLG